MIRGLRDIYWKWLGQTNEWTDTYPFNSPSPYSVVQEVVSLGFNDLSDMTIYIMPFIIFACYLNVHRDTSEKLEEVAKYEM